MPYRRPTMCKRPENILFQQFHETLEFKQKRARTRSRSRMVYEWVWGNVGTKTSEQNWLCEEVWPNLLRIKRQKTKKCHLCLVSDLRRSMDSAFSCISDVPMCSCGRCIFGVFLLGNAFVATIGDVVMSVTHAHAFQDRDSQTMTTTTTNRRTVNWLHYFNNFLHISCLPVTGCQSANTLNTRRAYHCQPTKWKDDVPRTTHHTHACAHTW